MELKERSIKDVKLTDHAEEELSDQDAEGLTINPNSIGLQIATYQSFCKSLLRVINLCFSSFYFGYTIAYLGTFDFAEIIKLYNIEKEQNTVQGLLQGITSVGAGIGALSASLVIKMFSRRNSILFINVLAFCFGLLIMYPNLYLFFAARFFQGACIGLYSAIIPLLIKEYSPVEISGTFGALNQTFIAFGVFFAFAFQLILVQINSELEHWRIIYGFTLITIVIQTLLLLFIYKQETPKYLLLHDREQDCIKYIEAIYRPEYVKTVLMEKKNDLNLKSAHHDLNQSNAEQIEVQKQRSKGKRIRIITAIHLAVLQQFVGINSVIAYGVDIASQILPSMAKVIPVILNFESFLASLISSIILAKFGRKIILQFGTLTSVISLLMVAVGFLIKSNESKAGNILIMVGLVIFMANFGLSLGPVVWLYIAEIVQPEIIPFSTLSNWTAASIVIITFPILSNAFGTPVPLFFFFTLWSAISFLVNNKLLIQTKGKTQKQIRQQYNNK